MEEEFDCRERVKKVILDVIDSTLLNLPITQDSPWVGLILTHFVNSIVINWIACSTCTYTNF